MDWSFRKADEEVAGALEASFGPWAVSGPALEIGRAALADKEWAIAMRARLAADRALLSAAKSKASWPAKAPCREARVHQP